MLARPHALLRKLFDAALAAARPAVLLPPFLSNFPAPRGRLVVIGAGKAAAAMARAVEDNYAGELSGLVVTRDGYGVRCNRIEVIEAAHPVPDARSQQAGQRMFTAVSGLTENDHVLALISGGGSALMSLPRDGLSSAEKQAVNRALLTSGASIHEMNCVRKHLSAIKGGQLAAAAWPAPVTTLAISDVPGDDPAVIASGPTVADPTTCADALAIISRYGIALPPAARAGLTHRAWETPKSDDPRLARTQFHLVGSAQASLVAAADAARAADITPLILGDALEGEAREAAKVMAGIALGCRRHGTPLAPPCVLLSGGETTVTVRGNGRGGRNSEFLLALALALGGTPGISALAADTDGIDGSEDNAGALITPDSLARAAALGLNPRAQLDANDAYPVFAALGDLIVTGPTMTNVNDFRAILIAG
jgi:hydroxypyruvate reductase